MSMTPKEFKNYLDNVATKYITKDRTLMSFVKEKKNDVDIYYDQPGHETNPDGFSNAQEKGETAFQRAIYLSFKSELKNKDNKKISVYWADMELPVVFHDQKPRRRPVDLIGLIETCDKNGRMYWRKPFLCELKYAGNRMAADSPVKAIIQLSVYYYFARDNKIKLDKFCVHRIGGRYFKWANLSNLLIIAANDKYWNEYSKIMPDVITLRDDINKKLRVDLKLFTVGEIGGEGPYTLLNPAQAWSEVS